MLAGKDSHLQGIISKSKPSSFLRQIYFVHNLCLTRIYESPLDGLTLLFVCSMFGVFFGWAADTNYDLYVGVYQKQFIFLPTKPRLHSLPQTGMLLSMIIGLAGSAFALNIYGSDSAMRIRDKHSGFSITAYWLAKTLVSIYQILLVSLHFSAFVVLLSRPLISFETYFSLVACLFLYFYGIAMFFSLVLTYEVASMVSVAYSLISAVLNGFGPRLPTLSSLGFGFVLYMQPSFWVTEAFFSENLNVYSHLYNNTLTASLYGFQLNQTGMSLTYALFIGTLWQVFVLGALLYSKTSLNNK